MEKTCKACSLTKPFEHFHKDRSKNDGLNSYCKPCTIAKQAEYQSHPPRRAAPEGMKYCGRCKETKPVVEFHNSTKTHDGFNKRCKRCSYLDHKSWTENNRGKAADLQKKWRDANPRRSKDHAIKSRYGLPLGSYENMLINQNGLCAICGTSEPGGRGDFHVDHCHNTNVVRGLLCTRCNVGIGQFLHDENLLAAAINYLSRTPPNTRSPTQCEP